VVLAELANYLCGGPNQCKLQEEANRRGRLVEQLGRNSNDMQMARRWCVQDCHMVLELWGRREVEISTTVPAPKEVLHVQQGSGVLAWPFHEPNASKIFTPQCVEVLEWLIVPDIGDYRVWPTQHVFPMWMFG